MPTVLITGTSSGIGRVTTKVLATRGWQVFATMRDMTKKGMLEAALDRAKLGGKVEILQLDVSDERSIYAAVAEVTTRTRNKIDAVVHNAGIAVAGAFEDMPQSEIRRVMETNFFGDRKSTRLNSSHLGISY